MSQPQPSPIDEFDRQQAERREIIEHRINLLLRIWFLGQIAMMGFLFLIVLSALSASPDPIPLAVLSGGFWLLKLVPSAWAGLLTLRNWSLLRRRSRIFGLVPWVALVFEATLLALAVA